jgi:hypothetical protein
VGGCAWVCVCVCSVILEHMGETAQAIEYLEFLQEDPPTTEGIGLTHVLGYLALCFENKGSIYLVALEGECEE